MHLQLKFVQGYFLSILIPVYTFPTPDFKLFKQ